MLIFLHNNPSLGARILCAVVRNGFWWNLDVFRHFLNFFVIFRIFFAEIFSLYAAENFFWNFSKLPENSENFGQFFLCAVVRTFLEFFWNFFAWKYPLFAHFCTIFANFSEIRKIFFWNSKIFKISRFLSNLHIWARKFWYLIPYIIFDIAKKCKKVQKTATHLKFSLLL